MYYLKVNDHFDAAHFLRNYQGKCANVHGHTWQVQAVVKGTKLNKQGLLIDFGILKKLLAIVVEQLDHKLINDVKGFSENEMNPTAENIACFIFNQLRDKLPEEITLSSIEVWESPKSSAIYSQE
ncbi:MAG: 6-carboxytetrahydropterin synthase QueD [Bacillota bacterium]|nr:6-carboxytetrahydropterin synthase QueD [Bacillota bacterium]